MRERWNQASPASRKSLIAVTALTFVGLAVRAWGMRQSLDGDELFTWNAINGRPLGDVIDRVSNGYEANPPLFYIFAWLAWKVGGAFSWIRIPSLIAGTALIPSIWLLGRRCAGELAGVVAAALVTVGASWIFYSNEARAYSLLALVVCLSTLTLLQAVKSTKARFWVLTTVLSITAVYTHYTALIVVAVQFLWVIIFLPGSRRQALLSAVITGIAFLPWSPNVGNRSDAYLRFAFGEFNLSISQLAAPVKGLIGMPFVPLSQVPGLAATCVFLAALLVGGLLLGRRAANPVDTGQARGTWSSPIVLLSAIALAMPVALTALGARHNAQILTARNLTAVLPATLVLVAWTLTSGRGWLRNVILVLAVGAGAVGGVIALTPDYQRPAAAEVAARIDELAGPKDIILFADRADTVSTRRLDVHLGQSQRPLFATLANQEKALAKATANGSKIFLVVSQTGVGEQVGWDPAVRSLAFPPAGLVQKLRVVLREHFPGLGGGLSLVEFEPLKKHVEN